MQKKKNNYVTYINDVGFEVFREVVTKRSVYWDITRCSLSKDNRNFRGICGLRGYSQEVNQHEAGNKLCRISTLKVEATCSSETSANPTDYTALYPRTIVIKT
jgi:hypothetical protein